METPLVYEHQPLSNICFCFLETWRNAAPEARRLLPPIVFCLCLIAVPPRLGKRSSRLFFLVKLFDIICWNTSPHPDWIYPQLTSNHSFPLKPPNLTASLMQTHGWPQTS